MSRDHRPEDARRPERDQPRRPARPTGNADSATVPSNSDRPQTIRSEVVDRSAEAIETEADVQSGSVEEVETFETNPKQTVEITVVTEAGPVQTLPAPELSAIESKENRPAAPALPVSANEDAVTSSTTESVPSE